MVEMMVTVVIISVCLVMALRVFSVCAAAVSGATSSTYAVGILQEKMDALREKAVMEDGVEVSAAEESVAIDGREFRFTQEVNYFVLPAEESSEAQEEPAEEETGLCEVRMTVSWGVSGGRKELALKTILPARGFGHEF